MRQIWSYDQSYHPQFIVEIHIVKWRRNVQVPSAHVCMGLGQRSCVLENLVAYISKLKEHYQSRNGI